MVWFAGDSEGDRDRSSEDLSLSEVREQQQQQQRRRRRQQEQQRRKRVERQRLYGVSTENVDDAVQSSDDVEQRQRRACPASEAAEAFPRSLAVEPQPPHAAPATGSAGPVDDRPPKSRGIIPGTVGDSGDVEPRLQPRPGPGDAAEVRERRQPHAAASVVVTRATVERRPPDSDGRAS